MTLQETEEAAKHIQEAADSDANIIVGMDIDEQLGDNMRITVIATGFDMDNANFERKSVGTTSATSASEQTQSSQSITPHIIPPPQFASERLGERPLTPNLPFDRSQKINKPRSRPTINDFDSSDLDVPSFIRKKHISDFDEDELD